jgi:hypothetical protein
LTIDRGDQVGDDLRTFLVECYAPAGDGTSVEAVDGRIRAASGELHDAGRPVTYLGAMLVPQDEIAFHVFKARDAGPVREASIAAALVFERIVESVAVGITLGRAGPRARQTRR